MICSSYCTAGSYNTTALLNYLNDHGLEPKCFDDVIYVQKESPQSENVIDIFFFPFGCTIVWGADESKQQSLLKEIKTFEIDPVVGTVSDFIYFKYNQESDKSFIDEEQNVIILGNNSAFVKLSISHALAQSVKLNVLELSVSNLIDRAAPIQQELANTGSVSLSKKEISKKIGMLFNERYSINLHSDILDVPEFFWRRPRYEPLYLMTVEFQDIRVRQEILNHRLDMIHELYNMLSNELNYKHSTRLEVIIILLIASEVILGLVHNNSFSSLFNWLMQILSSVNS